MFIIISTYYYYFKNKTFDRGSFNIKGLIIPREKPGKEPASRFEKKN